MGSVATVNSNKPKASRTQMVVLAGVSIVGLAVVVRMVSQGPQSAPAASVSTLPDQPLPGAMLSPTPTKTSLGPLSVTWPTDVARDPFHSDLVFPPAAPPPVVEPKPDPSTLPPVPPPVDLTAVARERLQLKATVLGERPIAMMNGRVYRTNEVVEGFTIVEIRKTDITVERDGKRIVIEVQ